MNRCLTWNATGLYACITEPYDPFSIGLSTDRGSSFAPIYRLADTCPQQCPADGAFVTTCRNSWSTPPGGAGWITMATGATCSVPWARVAPTSDAGNDAPGSSSDAGRPEADANLEPTAPADRSCACRIGVDRDRSRWSVCAALCAVAFGARRRNARRRDPRH
jgi:hypothetical protein